MSDNEIGVHPSWGEIKQAKWKDIESRYLSGDRDKEMVCAWMAYKAALKVCKGWPQGSFDELLTEGYQTAVRRWPDYDPTKATKNGISGFLYKAAHGRMRNAAKELFTAHGKRKHKATDVLPDVSVVADIETHLAHERRSPATGIRDNSANKDNFTKSDVGGVNDKAVTSAARKAERTKNYNFKWTTQVKAPTGGGGNASRLGRIATEIHVHRLLALLPNKADRDIIACAWGIDGVEEATVEELAYRAGCSVSTMYSRINKLLIELKFISRRTDGGLSTRPDGRYTRPDEYTRPFGSYRKAA